MGITLASAENSVIWGKGVAADDRLLLSNTSVPGFKGLKQDVTKNQGSVFPHPRTPTGTFVLKEIKIRLGFKGE